MLNSQKICIIGSGLTGLMIAYLLSKFRLQIDIVEQDFNKKKINPTKIALSKSSLDELCRYGLKDIRKKSNIIKNIYLHDSYSSISLKQDLHFSVSNKKEALAYIIDSNTLFSDIYKKLKSLKNINFLNKEISSINDEKFFKEITFKDLIKKNYNLIIFASANNLSLLSKFKLRKVVDKSVIWSIKNNSINKKYVSNKKYLSKFFNNHFKELFKEIISISEINKFNLNYSFNELKDSKRTLLFGEIANKIHPIAGQGWNMTLRNIFSLIKVIKYSINLGLEIGNDIFIKKYLDETNLNNLAFATLIDGIRKIFDIRIDSYAAIRKNTLSNLDKNFFIKKNFINIANKGLFI